MTRLKALCGIGLAVGLAACSGPGNGGSSSLITGSIFSGPPKTAASADGAPAVKPEDPLARPANVAWISARAVKCGFYFDPAKLRQSFLAAQAAEGVRADQLAAMQRTYDASFTRVTNALAENDSYCDAQQTAEIKASLNRHLAGDFSTAKPTKVAAKESMFGWLTEPSTGNRQMSRNDVLFPSGGGHTAE